MQEYGTDQITVQRMMATGSQRKTFKAILFNAGTDLVVISTLLFIGLGLLSFYHLNHSPPTSHPIVSCPTTSFTSFPTASTGCLSPRSSPPLCLAWTPASTPLLPSCSMIINRKSDRNKSSRHHHFTWHSRHWHRLLCLLDWRPY